MTGRGLDDRRICLCYIGFARARGDKIGGFHNMDIILASEQLRKPPEVI